MEIIHNTRKVIANDFQVHFDKTDFTGLIDPTQILWTICEKAPYGVFADVGITYRTTPSLLSDKPDIDILLCFTYYNGKIVEKKLGEVDWETGAFTFFSDSMHLNFDTEEKNE